MNRKKIRAKKIRTLKDIMKEEGFKEDRWGNMKGERNEHRYRYKFQATSLRKEIKGDKSGRWLKVYSAYYKDIDVYDETDITNKRFIVRKTIK